MSLFRLLFCAAALAMCSLLPVCADDAPVHRDLPMRTEGKLQVFVETAGFRGPEGLTRLEIYSLLDARQLQFVPESGKLVSQVDFSAILRDAEGNEVRRELWSRNISVTDMQAVRESGALVRDAVGFDVKPGAYHLSFNAEDIYADRAGACDGHILVRSFEGPALAVSDLVFAAEISPAKESGRFVKHSLQVIPNTTRFIREGDSLNVYFEAYNFKTQTDRQGDSFVLGYSLIDTGNVAVKTYPAKRLVKPGESMVKTETLSTAGVPGGVYFLQVELFDRGAREHVRQNRRFFILRDQAEVAQLTAEEEAQLRAFKNIQHVATPSELTAYERLTSNEDQLKFLSAFWKKLDPTPDTPLNERLLDHMMRVRYADENFTAQPGKRGSDTDKGRVYIKYGPPDERDYATSAAGGKGVDTWIYEKAGRYIFVFYDRRGTGVYELVHSTMSGEMYNPDWQRTAF